jgi:hypothetical protein
MTLFYVMQWLIFLIIMAKLQACYNHLFNIKCLMVFFCHVGLHWIIFREHKQMDHLDTMEEQ